MLAQMKDEELRQLKLASQKQVWRRSAFSRSILSFSSICASKLQDREDELKREQEEQEARLRMTKDEYDAWKRARDRDIDKMRREREALVRWRASARLVSPTRALWRVRRRPFSAKSRVCERKTIRSRHCLCVCARAR